MENRALRIFLCCFICAGIGTLISLEVNKYFWWVGVLTGSFLGYISYDFNKVITVAPKAWKAARGCKIDWKKTFWVTKSLVTIYVSLFGFAINITVLMVLLRYSVVDIDKSNDSFIFYIQMFFFMTALISFPLSLLPFAVSNSNEESLIKCALDLSRDARKANFFRVYFYLLPKGIFWCVKKTPHAVIISAKGIGAGSVILAKFIKYLFILIHSEWRLLCATDSAIGTLIGYLYGNIAMGAIAGGVIGILNYEVVSKRILKLKIVSK